MSNSFNVTEAEYQTALERLLTCKILDQDSADYWQLCCAYRGETYSRLSLARALTLLRGA